MGPDEEVRKDSCAHATRCTISLKHLAGEEPGRSRSRSDFDHCLVQHAVKILDPVIADRNLRLDDIVDENRPGQSSFLQARQRPLRPFRIIGHEIE